MSYITVEERKFTIKLSESQVRDLVIALDKYNVHPNWAHDLKSDLIKFGGFFHEIWMAKKMFDKRVSDPHIDMLYETGVSAGALGGKVLGAGGGGYILFFCQHLKRPDVAKKLKAKGGEIMDFNFDFRGLQTWTVPSR